MSRVLVLTMIAYRRLCPMFAVCPVAGAWLIALLGVLLPLSSCGSRSARILLVFVRGLGGFSVVCGLVWTGAFVLDSTVDVNSHFYVSVPMQLPAPRTRGVAR